MKPSHSHRCLFILSCKEGKYCNQEMYWNKFLFWKHTFWNLPITVSIIEKIKTNTSRHLVTRKLWFNYETHKLSFKLFSISKNREKVYSTFSCKILFTSRIIWNTFCQFTNNEYSILEKSNNYIIIHDKFRSKSTRTMKPERKPKV